MSTPQQIAPEQLLSAVTEPEVRSNPFPLYAAMREHPVCRQSDGVYVVSTHREVSQLLHDPRLSSDPRNVEGLPAPPRLPFILQDSLDHARLRRLAMAEFGPPETPGLVAAQEPTIQSVIDGKLDEAMGRQRIDVVSDISYPLPVAVICSLLGVPPEDEPKFHVWADNVVRATGAVDQPNSEELLELMDTTRLEMFLYFSELVGRHRDEPNDSMLSRLANSTEEDRLSDDDLAVTGIMLFIAGHETTVNLVTNGMLTLLRHPRVLEELRAEPELAVPLVEELLRFEAPIQYLPDRNALVDIEVAGVTIPAGSRVVLMLASASRDPDLFERPDEFDPHRDDLQHFGFGGGVHYCFGAPLARLEAQLALRTLAQRLVGPSLVSDPPPYRPSPLLRGPSELLIDVDRVAAADEVVVHRESSEATLSS